jgi:hypothetical protein
MKRITMVVLAIALLSMGLVLTWFYASTYISTGTVPLGFGSTKWNCSYGVQCSMTRPSGSCRPIGTCPWW